MDSLSAASGATADHGLMTPTLIIPMDLPADGLNEEGHALGFVEPLLSFGVIVLVLALLAATFIYLQRRGIFPPLTGRKRATPAPELAARQVLAERLARGDLTPEDFLERASILNWTPGSEDHPNRRVGRR